jgi:hypothetical protein
MESNREDKVLLNQPVSLEERRRAARILVDRFAYDIPLAIDGMDNRAEAAYAAWPERLYVVDKGGRIAYRGGLGPFGFDPRDMERALSLLLANGPPGSRRRTTEPERP